MLISAYGILKDVSVVSFLNTGSTHCMLQARIYIPASEKRVLNVSRLRKRTKHIGKRSCYGRLGQQIGRWRWIFRKTASASLTNFFSAREKADLIQLPWVDSRVSEPTKELLQKRRAMKRENGWDIMYSILCRLIRRRMKRRTSKNTVVKVVYGG